MLLTITATGPGAEDLSYLLMKHPDRVFERETSVGRISAFFPAYAEGRTQAALLYEMDPVAAVRGEARFRGLDEYVNDRPYAASSFLSQALKEAYGSAMAGRCRDRPDAVSRAIDLEARIPAVAPAGGPGIARRLFEPLGYEVSLEERPLDDAVPGLEDASGPLGLALRKRTTLRDLLTHLYVLVPVLDDARHHYIAESEVENLVRHGEGWLETHPEKALIASRFLAHRRGFVRDALALLDPEAEADREGAEAGALGEAALEAKVDVPEAPGAASASPSPQDLADEVVAPGAEPLEPVPPPSAAGAPDAAAPAEPEGPARRLHDLRLDTVLARALSLPPRGGRAGLTVVDMGAGEGKLLRRLLEDRRCERAIGVDVSVRTLAQATRRLGLERMPPRKRERLALLQGSLLCRDARLLDADVVALVEVIEHVEPDRLPLVAASLFGALRPRRAVITTPNREYNVRFPGLAAGRFRHTDHRFEWTRAEAATWALGARAYGYAVTQEDVGPLDPEVGAPSQLLTFDRE